MIQNKIYIPIILGTARKGRQSIKVARFVYKELKKIKEVKTEFIDVRKFASERTIPSWEKSELFQPWRDKVKMADGFIFVVPEYNHSFPGEFKTLFDSAFSEYKKKVCAVCSVSSGGLGGARVVEHLLPLFHTTSLHITKNVVYFSEVEELFDKGGSITDKSYEKNLQKMFKELIWYAKTLKEGRKVIKDI